MTRPPIGSYWGFSNERELERLIIYCIIAHTETGFRYQNTVFWRPRRLERVECLPHEHNGSLEEWAKETCTLGPLVPVWPYSYELNPMGLAACL